MAIKVLEFTSPTYPLTSPNCISIYVEFSSYCTLLTPTIRTGTVVIYGHN